MIPFNQHVATQVFIAYLLFIASIYGWSVYDHSKNVKYYNDCPLIKRYRPKYKHNEYFIFANELTICTVLGIAFSCIAWLITK